MVSALWETDLALVLCIDLVSPVSGVFPWGLSSLMDLRKVVNFQFLSIFLVKMGLMTFKLFMSELKLEIQIIIFQRKMIIGLFPLRVFCWPRRVDHEVKR